MTETTFAMIKTKGMPYMPLVFHRIWAGNLIIARAQQTKLDESLIQALYHEHVEKAYFPDLRESVSGLVILMALEGHDAVAKWREMLGPTDPKKAELGDIRHLARHEPCMADNIAHGSDSLKSADHELQLMFGRNWFRRNVWSNEDRQMSVSWSDPDYWSRQI